MNFVGRVNWKCEKLKLNEYVQIRSKASFTQGITAEKYAGVTTRTHARLKQNQDVTLQHVLEECERIFKLRHNTEEIEQKDCFQVKQLRNSQNRD